MKLTDRDLAKIQAKGISLVNDFGKEKTIEVYVDDPDFETLSYLFSLMKSFVVFHKDKELRVKIRKVNRVLSDEVSTAKLLRAFVEVFRALQQHFKFQFNFTEDDTTVYLTLNSNINLNSERGLKGQRGE